MVNFTYNFILKFTSKLTLNLRKILRDHLACTISGVYHLIWLKFGAELGLFAEILVGQQSSTLYAARSPKIELSLSLSIETH